MATNAPDRMNTRVLLILAILGALLAHGDARFVSEWLAELRQARR